jgi:hypothetical protein
MNSVYQQYQECRPASIYFMLAMLILLIGAIFTINMLDVPALFSRVASIIVCTLILIGLCGVAPSLAWAFVIVYVLCLVSFSLMLIFGDKQIEQKIIIQ